MATIPSTRHSDNEFLLHRKAVFLLLLCIFAVPQLEVSAALFCFLVLILRLNGFQMNLKRQLYFSSVECNNTIATYIMNRRRGCGKKKKKTLNLFQRQNKENKMVRIIRHKNKENCLFAFQSMPN